MKHIIKILAILAIILFCLHAFSDNKAELDIWGNVGFVKAFPWQDGFKHLNTFSFTEPGRPWINHEWLSEYILHFIFILFGSAGLLVFKFLLGLCLIGMLFLAMKRALISGPIIFLWLILTISTIGYGFSTRPHLMTYILYSALLFILSWRDTARYRYLFFLPVLGILWVNLHGAFFIGVIILILYAIFEWGNKKIFPKKEMAVTALFILATFINPYALRLWKYIFYSASIPRPYLSEWAPFVRPAYIIEHIDFVFLAVVSFAAIYFSRRRNGAFWITALFVSFISAFAMRRNIPLFAITAAFVVPQYLEELAGDTIRGMVEKISRVLLAAMLFIFAAVSLLYAVTFYKTYFSRIEVSKKQFPVDVVSFMKANDISGNALVFFDWGEYCIWKLYPECKVFMDGRFCCAYSVKTINDFFGFLYLDKNWENALKNYPTDIVLIHKGNPVYAKMLTMPGWEYIYEDGIAGLFIKKSGQEQFFSKIKKGLIQYPDVKKHEYFP